MYAEPLESRVHLSAAVSNGVLTVRGSAGNDIIKVYVRGLNIRAVVNGVIKSFPISGIQQVVVRAAAGNDQVQMAALPFNAIVRAGAGNDLVRCGSGSDLLDGGPGNDTLEGNNGDDTLLGGDGDDKLYGGNDSDTLQGQAGNDTLDGGLGRDILSGGDGVDLADYSLRTENLSLSNDSINNDGAAGELDNIVADVEKIRAGSGSDSLTGNSANNVLIGGSGNDTLLGMGGDDSLEGGGGDDALTGGPGADTLNGGLGNDLLYAIDNQPNDVLLGGPGEDIGHRDELTTSDTATDVETLLST